MHGHAPTPVPGAIPAIGDSCGCGISLPSGWFNVRPLRPVTIHFSVWATPQGLIRENWPSVGGMSLPIPALSATYWSRPSS